jgi:hypothetical protein
LLFKLRNGCAIEKPPRDFAPVAYYQHISQNKQLFFVVEPKKIEKILAQFRSEFIEILIRQDKMEVNFIKSLEILANDTKFSTKNKSKDNQLFQGVLLW